MSLIFKSIQSTFAPFSIDFFVCFNTLLIWIRCYLQSQTKIILLSPPQTKRILQNMIDSIGHSSNFYRAQHLASMRKLLNNKKLLPYSKLARYWPHPFSLISKGWATNSLFHQRPESLRSNFVDDAILVDDVIAMPRFVAEVNNQTVTAGRSAHLTCKVRDLGNYKVAWVRVDTQTILTIHHNIITRNQRISLSHHDHKIWRLHINNVQESDRGWYMCQVNTDPMRSQRGFLEVVGKLQNSVKIHWKYRQNSVNNSVIIQSKLGQNAVNIQS